MHLTVVDDLTRIPAADWNALAGTDNPFVRHEFLVALEHSGAVGGTSGWQPMHLAVYADDGRLLGAAPCYLKRHSYGEYVFDWSWAEAHERAGLHYYPKLVCAVPFTPVAGPRLLLGGASPEAVADLLIRGAHALAQELDASSVHWLFLNDADAARFARHGLLERRAFQFHWHNRDYRDFKDYLAGLTSEKRKKLRRERRRVHEAGVRLRMANGEELVADDWKRFYAWYDDTVSRHGGTSYLTPAFFHEIGRTMPGSVRMALAERAGARVAAALFLQGSNTLYGRYWGGVEAIPDLHFETCYHFPIEHCIAEGLTRFEAGAQGGHKLARGLTPVATRSAHWLAHPALRRAVGDFLAREQQAVEYHMNELGEHAPYKHGRIA